MPEEIGERISALSNGACIHNQQNAYLVFGVEDKTHIIKGTTFKAKSHKKGGEELEHWLANRLDPRIDFTIYEFDYEDDKHISMFIIPATKNRLVEFLHQAYIRIGSITRKLNDFPEKQAKIWNRQHLLHRYLRQCMYGKPGICHCCHRQLRKQKPGDVSYAATSYLFISHRI